MAKINLKKIIGLVKEQLNPDLSTIEGLKTYLTTWYVLKFQTTFKDPILLQHTLEELLFLFYTYRISEDPSIGEDAVEEAESYEEWLKKQMGEDYVSEEEMVHNMVEYSSKEKELAKKLPDKLGIDFSSLGEEP